MLFGANATPILRFLNDAPNLAPDGDRFCTVAPADAQTDLSKIEISLSGSGGQWFSNAVFAGHPNASSFAPFYPASTLPSNARPLTPYQEPGKYTTATGFQGVVLSLSGVTCTSQYGGSIRLTFTTDEDLQYELNDGTYLWDFAALSLHVFVVPTAIPFNSRTLARNATVHIEAEPHTPTRYSTATRNLAPVSGSDAALDAALQSAVDGIESSGARTVGTNIPGNAASFVYGYLRDRFADRFTSWTELVDAVEVSENFVDLVTRTGTKQYYMSARINGIDLSTEPGGEEFKVDINTTNGTDVKNIELGEDEASSFQTIARVSGSSCNGGEIVVVNVWIEESDPGFDDTFSAGPLYLEMNCPQLAAATAVGTVESHRSDNIIIQKGVSTEPAGWLSMSFRVGVILR